MGTHPNSLSEPYTRMVVNLAHPSSYACLAKEAKVDLSPYSKNLFFKT